MCEIWLAVLTGMHALGHSLGEIIDDHFLDALKPAGRRGLNFEQEEGLDAVLALQRMQVVLACVPSRPGSTLSSLSPAGTMLPMALERTIHPRRRHRRHAARSWTTSSSRPCSTPLAATALLMLLERTMPSLPLPPTACCSVVDDLKQISEPQRWGLSSAKKKVLAYFYGTRETTLDV